MSEHEYIEAKILQQKAVELYNSLQEKIKANSLTAKEKTALPQQEMPTQEPKVRAKNMQEVATGYTKEMAVLEANRCLQCKNAPCVSGCPVNVQIPQFIQAICHEDFKKAVSTIKETNLLPAICGRVCPQEKQCQGQCTLGKVLGASEKAVSIGRLERFVADYERECGTVSTPIIAQPTGKKVAVIGSGPAGLTVAADCAKLGHSVTVFEAFHKAGGVMLYGIPEFRLPKAIVANEVENLKKMGVKFETNFLVGRTATLDELLDEMQFDAAFVGTGAGLPKFLGIPGENYVGVFSANEYLSRANLMKAYMKNADTPYYHAHNVVVTGGGNVAMDAARMALRLGADNVTVVYRRTRKEMPARIEEIAHAEEEGVAFRFLESPIEVLAQVSEDRAINGRVRAIKALSYELGEPDATGRRSPVAIKGSEHEIACDALIVALGNGSNPLLIKTTPGLNADKKGHITVDEKQATNKCKVWAGGDIVLGSATVILAMGEGRKAASSINEYLSNN